MVLDLEEILMIGEDHFFESVSPTSSYGVTFEDDLTTGYFYAIDTKPELQILDALHIYDVANIVNKEQPSKIQITWDDSGQVASLLINNYCHAIFDFENKASYCRNGFPESNRKWSLNSDRTLTDDLINEIFKSRN